MPSAVEVAAAVAERGALFAHEGGRKASLSKEGSRGRPRGVSMERPSGEGAVSFVEASYWSQGEQHAISVVAGALEELGECHFAQASQPASQLVQPPTQEGSQPAS